MWIKHSKTFGCSSHQRELESNYEIHTCTYVYKYIYVCYHTGIQEKLNWIKFKLNLNS